jgi:hypothetical protein
MDIAGQVRTALIAEFQTTPLCCIATNPLIPELRTHGVKLLPAVEVIVREVDNFVAIPAFRLRHNLGELFSLYFRIAHENDWDYASFVASLDGKLFDHAEYGIASVWGTNDSARLTVISEPLFKILCQRESRLLTTLNRLIKIGQLSFDPAKPGKRAPQRVAPE